MKSDYRKGGVDVTNVQEMKFFTSLDEINSFDDKAVRKISEKLDEREQAIIHKAAFGAMQKILGMLSVLLLILAVGTLILQWSAGYIIYTLILTCIIYGIFFRESWKAEYKKNTN